MVHKCDIGSERVKLFVFLLNLKWPSHNILSVFNVNVTDPHGLSKSPRGKGILLHVEQPSVNGGVLSLYLVYEIIEHFIHD